MIGISFLDNLISEVGMPLVKKGVKALTGIDLESQELTPEDKQKLLDSQIEIMKIDFEKLKLNEEVKLKKTQQVLDDKKDARERETKITEKTGRRDYALIVLAAVIVIGFFGGLISLVYVTLDKGSGTYELLYMMFGALISKFGTVVDYFFGSSEQK